MAKRNIARRISFGEKRHLSIPVQHDADVNLLERRINSFSKFFKKANLITQETFCILNQYANTKGILISFHQFQFVIGVKFTDKRIIHVWWGKHYSWNSEKKCNLSQLSCKYLDIYLQRIPYSRPSKLRIKCEWYL